MEPGSVLGPGKQRNQKNKIGNPPQYAAGSFCAEEKRIDRKEEYFSPFRTLPLGKMK